ncbi:trypsin-like peptidase domain-containing protein [Mobilitalea sibirica]|uniref:Trypsin-like peptidase domain-containing protein n=1 Tax=Mobilitalea sibirica TaxID=1462919 RepID=A0A8J7H1N0_9FIRM|nr:trypsin-like peptidase domain-containing protein [Mobilitalea sibirica]MBH1940363.1 trypsin-like peptidase domain-containing protein [Mobilitalea sibirica]
MDDYNKDMNQDSRDNGIENSQEQKRRIPEYSFWAEQMTTEPKQNDSNPSWQYNYVIQDKEQHNIDNSNEVKKKHRVVKFILKAACFGILAGAGFFGVQSIYDRVFPDTTREESSYILGASDTNQTVKTKLKVGVTESGSVNLTSKSAISDMIDMTMPSIVSISSVSTQSNIWFGQEYDVEGSGSGIIVGKNEEELLIATNNHVVAGTNKITVTFIDGNQAEAVIKGTDASADLAVITVDINNIEEDTREIIEVAQLGDSDKVKVGEMAVAIGNALGYGQSVTVGYVSAKDREVEVSDNYSYKKMILLQTDAAINPGNSGGALMNVDGEVIGINTIKYASHDVEGMGYAIPISKAMPIINELMNREILKTEEQGFLGVTPTDVTEEISETWNMPIGVYLSDVMKDSAAQKAGLLQGDIITSINDIEITSGVQLREKVSSIRAGTEIEVTFMRSENGTYKEHTVTVKLGARPVEIR